MKNLLWIDLEMTGLDERIDSILEIAIVITDMDFKVLDEFHRIVYQPQEALDRMGDWCKKTHGDSGLTAAIATGAPLPDVEKEVLALLPKYFPAHERIVLVGNSVNNDRRFIDKYMPEFAKKLHYRLIDVSSYKEIFRDKYSLVFQKKNTHRAVDDIHESIKELSFYLSYVNVKPNGNSSKSPSNPK
jgi:oligoribonuclease